MPLKNILLVDDSEAEQFLYKAIIQKYDPSINITPAFDGIEALETLGKAATKPDCILLDINMPRMNGFDFLEAYSKKYQNGHIIIAMLTSSAQTTDKDKAMSYECVNDFYIKPITMEDLDNLSKLAR